jgi:hypothetical protein
MNCRSSLHSSLADVGMFLGLNRRLDSFPRSTLLDCNTKRTKRSAEIGIKEEA